MIVKGAPNIQLNLDFIYGYRSQDVRNNLYFTANDNLIVYHAAGVGIVYDLQSHKQWYNLDLGDGEGKGISCLDLSHDQHTVATGELGKIPRICLWDSNSGNTLIKLRGYHRVGIAHVKFSDSGRLLSSVFFFFFLLF